MCTKFIITFAVRLTDLKLMSERSEGAYLWAMSTTCGLTYPTRKNANTLGFVLAQITFLIMTSVNENWKEREENHLQIQLTYNLVRQDNNYFYSSFGVKILKFSLRM